MDPTRFTRVDATTWRIEPHGAMRVPAIIYADENLIRDMDDKVYEQAANVATLPGIVQASYVMPDAHWGYGFPIGGVAAFDPDQGGVISAGGVGFDISCGVRTMLTGLKVADILPVQKSLADSLFRQIPAGVGSKGAITLDAIDMDAMLAEAPVGPSRAAGAKRATSNGSRKRAGWRARDPNTCRTAPRNDSAAKWARSDRAITTLEVQAVAEIFDAKVAEVFGLADDDVVVTIHCGSRGLGHQIGTEFLKEMVVTAQALGIELPDRELACAPINSEVGQRYLGAMRAAINCALANREILGHYVRRVFAHFFPELRPASAVRRVAQHLQGRIASRGRQAARSVRSSQGRDQGLRTRSPEACPTHCVRLVSRCSSAAAWAPARTFWSAKRRRKQGVLLGVPRRRTGAVAPRRAQAMERPQDRR